ncbi:MAG: hypothetical protein QOF21_89 [Actinomycetota bacterium]|jgi:hypothetical protein
MRRLTVLLVSLLLLSACGSDSDSEKEATGRTAAGDAPVWAAPADPLERTRAAGLEPELRETLTHHAHSHLDVFFNGTAVLVPGGIGIATTDPGVKRFDDDPKGTGYGGIEGCDQPCISPLHTHGPDGILHTESADAEPRTLGQFFTEWGVALDSKCVGEYCNPTTDVAIYVNGKAFRGDPAGIKLTDRKEIAIVIGRPPAKVPSAGDFSGA